MGSTILTKNEAAARLGVHLRTVYRYIKEGQLRRVMIDRFHVGVYEEDVETLKKSWPRVTEIEELQVPFNRRSFQRMNLELKCMRRELDTVLRMLNARLDKLSIDHPEALAYYQQFQEYAEQGWPPHVEAFWTSQILRFRPDTLEKMEEATSDPDPWKPLYKFIATMAVRPFNKELAQDAVTARDHVLDLIRHWFEAKGRSPRGINNALAEAHPSKWLLNRLEKQQQVPAKG